MEQIRAHRDQTTRDFHNKIDSRRQGALKARKVQKLRLQIAPANPDKSSSGGCLDPTRSTSSRRQADAIPRHLNSARGKTSGQARVRVSERQRERSCVRSQSFGVARSRRVILRERTGPAAREASAPTALIIDGRHPPRTRSSGVGAAAHSQDAVSRHCPRARRACVPPWRARRCPGKSSPLGLHRLSVAITHCGRTVHRRRSE